MAKNNQNLRIHTQYTHTQYVVRITFGEERISFCKIIFVKTENYNEIKKFKTIQSV